jgi:serine/threonine protein kinase
MPTAEIHVVESPKAPAETSHVARIISSDSIPAGGFTPGTILADRYRVIGLLGRGGMGEVYRADDLKLGQAVALKFLPPKLAEDPVRRERFFAEVRITRQLSHPNICRVYDIGEIEGRHFLSMEFIDGEDLASLLKRIGHLTNEKALDIARQLAAGLAAAHERGVLHRDLKPANIMLDGHGRVRITDFGLAIAQGDETQAAEIAGTPAYMAPEQLAGKGATVRSDMYSLGLVLYEIYTGKKAFTATALAELRQQKETHTPRAISELREGMDPVVERLIGRCMERDPNARPWSVAQLALALPGGDPLAAGETPSPEMVAASGGNEGLKPWIAWTLLAFIILGLFAYVVTASDRLYQHIPFEKPPEALVERSRVSLQKAGLSGQVKDSAWGFMENSELLSYIRKSDQTENWLKKLDARAILFWYRQSPESLGFFELASGSTSPNNPPLRYSGEVLLILDTEGRLISMRRVPPRVLSGSEALPSPDWKPFFDEAGIDISQWMPSDAQWTPPFHSDSRAAWQGSLPGHSKIQARIEAASFQGKPVSFEIVGPWQRSSQMDYPVQQGTLAARSAPILFVILFALVCGIFFARRNLRMGRGDRKNATRLALFVLGSLTLQWALQLPQVSFTGLLPAGYMAVLSWILYLAIEPYVRRRWPQVLVSWTRLLSGEWQDPLVARDALVGVTFGTLILLARQVGRWLPHPLGGQNIYSPLGSYKFFLGTRFVIHDIFYIAWVSILVALATFCLIVFLTVLLRSQKAAIAVCFLLVAGPAALGAGLVQSGSVPSITFAAIWILALMRFGFVASIVALFAEFTMRRCPVPLQSSAWYSVYGYLLLAVLAALVLYAFRYSLGGRPLLASSRLDE